MNCRQVKPRIDAYLDHELDGATMLKVRDHLRTCPCCERELKSLQSLKSMLGGLRAPELSEARQEALVNHVMNARKVRVPDRTWRVALVAAVASGMLALVVLEAQSGRIAEPAQPVLTQSIDRDQAAMAAGDPLSGRPPILMTGHGR
jgi:anti-sigma factor RsiW